MKSIWEGFDSNASVRSGKDNIRAFSLRKIARPQGRAGKPEGKKISRAMLPG